jgi:hypothetical protein
MKDGKETYDPKICRQFKFLAWICFKSVYTQNNWNWLLGGIQKDGEETNSVAWGRKRTIPTDWATAACRRS